jgi:hypothetical protein
MLSGITQHLWLSGAAAALETIQNYCDIDLDTTPLDPHAALAAVRAS